MAEGLTGRLRATRTQIGVIPVATGPLPLAPADTTATAPTESDSGPA